MSKDIEEIARLREALQAIAEGNLGDAPWQANYARIRATAIEALNNESKPVENGRVATD